ncbi:MAG: HAD family hydrolase, partial [Clostridia bacterium]|nr:HAD family hydrolase [Clostridia bacterium]
MLARVDTVCFDKTGTITDGNMTVKNLVPLTDLNQTDLSPVISAVLGTLNDKNQTALALREYFGNKVGLTATAQFPFNSKRKLSAVAFKDKGVYALGAPEFVLDKKTFSEIENKINSYACSGLRVLVFAHSNADVSGGELPHDFSPLAIILLADNIRKDAYATVKWFKDNGVAVKVISGDNPITVSEVSARVGIENADKYISLDGLSDEEVRKAATEYTVFGRVSPKQKAILIKSMKEAGHTTAMTGDGVNDVLALKEADCAVTVASGSDAARNIAH